jgi:hypothetical protein
MKDVLKYIHENNLIPPLMVIDVLARSPSVQLGSVKVGLCIWGKAAALQLCLSAESQEYFMRRLEDENTHIERDEKEIERVRRAAWPRQAVPLPGRWRKKQRGCALPYSIGKRRRGCSRRLHLCRRRPRSFRWGCLCRACGTKGRVAHGAGNPLL